MAKVLKFNRRDGLMGSAPRKWIDKELPICPFCGKTPPGWEQAVEAKMGQNRYHFHCPSCNGILSISAAAATGGGTPLGLLFRSKLPKLLRIESVGHSGSALEVGKEMAPDDLTKMARA
jgi:hypothetical protein